MKQVIDLVETSDVATRSLSIVGQAKLIKVVDSASYEKAGTMWGNLKAMMAEVDEAFDKNIKRWHDGHKSALADKAKYYQPLDLAARSLKTIMADWKKAEDRRRQEEQDRIDAENRRIAEELRQKELARIAEEQKKTETALLDAAAEAEKSGNNELANEILSTAEEKQGEFAQEAAQVVAETSTPAPAVVANNVPKIKGGPVFQQRYDFEIKNINLIPRKYMIPDTVKIRQMVTALKMEAEKEILGIRVFPKTV